MRIDVLTTFPELFQNRPPGVLGVSIPARALAAGSIEVHPHDLRDYTLNKHGKTDDRPFGGGPGMVLTCQPVYDATRTIESLDPRPALRVLPSPQGVPLDQQLVERLAGTPRLLVLCGHYEGIDERVIEELDPLEVSLGDFVISGGELAALVLIDAVARLQPGVLGDAQSAVQDSFSSRADDTDRPLDCPHYTRPPVWRGRAVPDVLLSGDHQAIADWRDRVARERTQARRPDLLGDKPDAGEPDPA